MSKPSDYGSLTTAVRPREQGHARYLRVKSRFCRGGDTKEQRVDGGKIAIGQEKHEARKPANKNVQICRDVSPWTLALPVLCPHSELK
jgi:hypothetical protein